MRRSSTDVQYRGACPPAIALSLLVSMLLPRSLANKSRFQQDGFANAFPTLAYLVAIMSILSMAMLPRSKFIQTMSFNLIGVCLGSGIALLTCYCSVQARIHTSTPISKTTTGSSGAFEAVQYNSSASVVSAIWLFVNICFANATRFSRPQLQVPIIMYTIFAMVSVGRQCTTLLFDN